MNALGMRGFTFGIRSLQAVWQKIVGLVVTMRMIAASRPGDVIVIDNGGRMGSSCWGGILADAAKVRGVAATVICTARGRVIEESANQISSAAAFRSGRVISSSATATALFACRRRKCLRSWKRRNSSGRRKKT